MTYTALLLAGLAVLTCKTWALVDVRMEDVVEVTLKGQAKISCTYTLTEEAKMIIWFTKLPGKDQNRKRFYYSENQTEIIDQNHEYAERIKVSHSYDTEEERGSVVLILDDVQLTDEREFICMVHSVLNDVGEGRTHLKIYNSPSLPVIEREHTGISVSETEPSKVAQCKVDDGYPRPNITWYKGSFPLDPSDEVKILESVTVKPSGLFRVESELHIKVKKEDEGAHFYCEVKYLMLGKARMTESSRFNVTVHYPTTNIKLSINPPDKLIKEGDTLELQCEGNGNPQPIFSFRHGERDLINEDNGILHLKNVKRSDSGEYVCESLDLDTGMNYEDSLNIKVHYLDNIMVTPDETDPDQGHDITLTCNALSSLPTHTAWYKDGKLLVERHVLELHNASYETTGKYMCEVMVLSLPELKKQKSVQVNVRGKPEIKEGIKVNQMNKVNHPVNLTCYAQGYPIPNITWTLFDQQTGQIVPVLKIVNQMMDNSVHSLISVKATSDLIANCSATNELGTDDASQSIKAFVRVTTISPTSTTTEATEITVQPKSPQKGGSGVIIAVIIICLLLIAIVGSVLYYLYKKGKLPCGRSGKKDFMKQKASKDDIVMEMKSGKSEEAVLLQGVNGDKKSPTE
ncbi:melanoma cell adhesion molecule b isoform X2 [Danio rerio]|uniref:Melanoma cell adhesion molecule b isoform X2 n=1 Tax=Danio rerio TaxID=7955 RepID=A0A8M9QBW0_DANRE|nr:cell surface glycoprotein MUC18 isoform X2 [Danio rerio]|eukprot:XP_021337028.1 cell surface glycoprotein MUC18 isoform X2 [Danio rerio]